jgi:hypothetical protein
MWRKSSHSTYNGNCVEADGPWRKSSHCNGGDCVEVADGPAGLMRDSKDRDGPVLRFTPGEWAAFTGRVKNGEFDGDRPAAE